jgi:hypothetical protein
MTGISNAVRRRRIGRFPSARLDDEPSEFFLRLVVLDLAAAGEIGFEREPCWFVRPDFPLDIVAVQVEFARGVGGDPDDDLVALSDDDIRRFHNLSADPEIELARL